MLHSQKLVSLYFIKYKHYQKSVKVCDVDLKHYFLHYEPIACRRHFWYNCEVWFELHV